jgi:transposase-like protein
MLQLRQFQSQVVDGMTQSLSGMVGKHHIIAAVGVNAQGSKHVLGLAPGSSENAKVVKDLLTGLSERGLDLILCGTPDSASGFESMHGDVLS